MKRLRAHAQTLLGSRIERTKVAAEINSKMESVTGVVFFDHSAQPGGGQLSLLRYLENRQFENVLVIFMVGGPIAERIARLGIRVEILAQSETYSMWKILGLLPRLHRVVNMNRFNIIVANSLYAAAALALLPISRRRKKIYYSRLSMASLAGLKRWLVMIFIFPRFKGFIANSHWTASCIPAPLNKKPIHVAYPVSGISDTKSKVRQFPVCSRTEIRIVTLSRPDRWKGLDILVEATTGFRREFPTKRIGVEMFGGTFFSDADYLTELDRKAAASDILVTRHGHIDDVGAILRACDIVVLPTRQPEPFGQVVPQALAAGCVVIVSNHGGPLELIQDKINGLVFEPGSVDSLKARLREVIASSEFAESLSERAVLSAFQYEDSKTARDLEVAITRIAEG